MYKIGEFSKLAKTTIKTLRYYEGQGLFEPDYVDENGYRYYDARQLIELSKLISYRQIGYSKEGIIKDFSEASKFITDSANECLATN